MVACGHEYLTGLRGASQISPGLDQSYIIRIMNQLSTKREWFKPWGYGYLPISWQGFVATLVVVVICIVVFFVIDADSHSVSDTLIGSGFIIAPILGVLYWFARSTSGNR